MKRLGSLYRASELIRELGAHRDEQVYVNELIYGHGVGWHVERDYTRPFIEGVFVCSPFRAENKATGQTNIEVARAICHKASRAGLAPFAPHLIYPLFLDDVLLVEREAGIQAGLFFMASCQHIWVDARAGLSAGMIHEIKAAKKLISGIWRVFRDSSELPGIPEPFPTNPTPLVEAFPELANVG